MILLPPVDTLWQPNLQTKIPASQNIIPDLLSHLRKIFFLHNFAVCIEFQRKIPSWIAHPLQVFRNSQDPFISYFPFFPDVSIVRMKSWFCYGHAKSSDLFLFCGPPSKIVSPESWNKRYLASNFIHLRHLWQYLFFLVGHPAAKGIYQGWEKKRKWMKRHLSGKTKNTFR